MRNPPLYYLYAALPYKATSGLGIFDRCSRCAWPTSRRCSPSSSSPGCWPASVRRRRRLQALATIAVALQPQLIHMTAVVNPDVFLAGIWAAALYVMVLLVKRGSTRGGSPGRRARARVLPHPAARVAIVIPAAAALGLAFWRHASRAPLGAPGARRRRRRSSSSPGWPCSWTSRCSASSSGRHIRQFGSYLWQFYLPKLGS